MDYAALRAELTTDPAKLGYGPLLAAGSANRVADLLNAPTQAGLGKVGITPMLIWIAKHGVMARLRAGAASDNAGLASISEVALMLVSNPNIDAIDFGLPDVQAMLGALVQAGVIPADAYQELTGIATVQRSRAQVLGWGHVSADDVSRAMEG
jgi:hypothetical protein